MFSFTKVNGHRNLFSILVSVYTHLKKDDKLRIKPFRKPEKYLDSDDFRERYDLSRTEATNLKKAIQSNIVPEGKLKTKFYSIRKDLNQRLYTTIDLRGTDKTILWKFPEKTTEWPKHQILIGSSGAGKTFIISQYIIEALKRKKKRHFIYISPELNQDRTLSHLTNNKRWTRYFQGIDVSEETIEESEVAPVEFWEKKVLPVIKAAPPGACIILDDAPSAPIHKQLQAFLVKSLQTYRHKRVGVVSLQHKIRNGKWTSQSFSSVGYITLFPSAGGRGKQIDYLVDFGLTRKQAREIIEIFGDSGRFMTIHAWSPNVCFGPKYAVFV